MNMIVASCVYGFGEFVISSIAWGSFGYILFRAIGTKEKYWYWELIFLYMINMLWDTGINVYLGELGISIENREILEYFNYNIDNLFETSLFDYLINVLKIFLGYMFGKFIFKKIILRTPKS